MTIENEYRTINGETYIFVTNIESNHELVQKYETFNDKHGGVVIETAQELPDGVAIWLKESLEKTAVKEGLFTPSELQENSEKLERLFEEGIERRNRPYH